MLFKGGVAHIPIWVNSRHLLFNAHNNILQTIRIHVTIKIKHISFSFKAFLLSNLKYISEIILEKFLRANRAEVIAVSIFEYSKEEEEQKLRKAEYEAGVAEGELKKARETALSLAEMGLPVDKIAEAVKISRDKVEEWMKESMSIV